MTTIRTVAVVAALAMLATIVYGFVAGDFTTDGAALLDLAWGRVTMVDLYLAFAAVWSWIAFREGSVPAALLWAVLMITLGSLAIWGYIAWRSSTSRDATHLLLGDRVLSR